MALVETRPVCGCVPAGACGAADADLGHLHRTRRVGQLMPQILAPLCGALAAGAIGEMVGYLRGPGRTAESRAPVELCRRAYTVEGDLERGGLTQSRE